MHTGNGVVDGAMHTMKNLIIANLESGEKLTKSTNRVLRVMRFPIHTDLNKTRYEIHHGNKTRTEFTNFVKDGKSYLSDWSELSVLKPNRPKMLLFVGRDADGETFNHMIMPRTKSEKKQLASEAKSLWKNVPFNVRYR